MSQKNQDQVRAATRSLSFAYGSTRGRDVEELELNVSDMLCDLMHFCDAKDIDWSVCMGRAEEHHRYESKHGDVM